MVGNLRLRQLRWIHRQRLRASDERVLRRGCILGARDEVLSQLLARPQSGVGDVDLASTGHPDERPRHIDDALPMFRTMTSPSPGAAAAASRTGVLPLQPARTGLGSARHRPTASQWLGCRRRSGQLPPRAPDADAFERQPGLARVVVKERNRVIALVAVADHGADQHLATLADSEHHHSRSLTAAIPVSTRVAPTVPAGTHNRSQRQLATRAKAPTKIGTLLGTRIGLAMRTGIQVTSVVASTVLARSTISSKDPRM